MNNDKNKVSDKDMLQKIVRTECGRRLCKCGDAGCEFAADFFDEQGIPTAEFGEDADLIEKQNLTPASDYSDYAARVGLSGDGREESDDQSQDLAETNGEPKYFNEANYRMISMDDSAIDACKS